MIERFIDWQRRILTFLSEIAKFDSPVDELLKISIKFKSEEDPSSYSAQESYLSALKKWTFRYCSKSSSSTSISSLESLKNMPQEYQNLVVNDLVNLQIEGDLIEVKLHEGDLLWLVIRRFGLVPEGCCA